MINQAINARILEAAQATGVISESYGLVSTTVDAGRLIPIVCNSDDCEPGKFIPALPDSNKAGIVYAYAPDPVYERVPNQQSIIQFRVTAKVVFWYNAAKAGLSPCDLPNYGLILKVSQCLQRTARVELQSGVEGNLSANVGRLQLDPQNVFSPFQILANQPALGFWPYAAFALSVEFILQVPERCLTYTAPTPVECIAI